MRNFYALEKGIPESQVEVPTRSGLSHHIAHSDGLAPATHLDAPRTAHPDDLIAP